MPQELIVPVGRADAVSTRRLALVKDGAERSALHERLRNLWNLLVSNVTRTVPRLRSEDVIGLLAPDGRPTLVPPWDLPLDVVWGTDRPDNGRLFVLFAVEDVGSGEKSVFTVFEDRGPTNLPLAVVRLAGTVNFLGETQMADTEDTLRSLLRLFRNGQCEFKRWIRADDHSATLEVTTLALQQSKEGFAPAT
jgi:hypothetical protein